MPPTHTMPNAKNATLPHCPGDTHAQPSAQTSRRTSAKLVGLKRCLPFQRSKNLLATAAAGATAASQREFVRSRRQSDNPEISALRGSKVP